MFFAAFLLCAFCAPAGAFPAAAPAPLGAAADGTVQTVAAKSKVAAKPARKSRAGSSAASGIHPLVGSGDY
jgi:hypothetical protein